jgi:acid phosphatase type 7
MRSSIFLLGIAAFASLVIHSEPSNNSQVRLAYAGNTGMYVSWNTFKKLRNPAVIYGLSPSSMNKYASSDVSVTYPTSLTYNNHVKITGLRPDTTYYYLPIGMHEDGTPFHHETTSRPYIFRTSRPAGDGTPYSVAVVIDLGTMGSLGLTTTAGNGVASTNILGPKDNNTIQSLAAVKDSYDFLWHRKPLHSHRFVFVN